MLVPLACCCCQQVVIGATYYPSWKAPLDFHLPAVQEFEEPFGMLPFMVGRLCEYICDLYVPILPRLLSEVGVTVSRLGFPGKGCK